jgi:transcription-repair coupling factor (superfamily II helicase)
MIDRFGLLPDAGEEPVPGRGHEAARAQLGIRKLELGPTGGRVLFTAKPAIDPLTIIRMVQREPKRYAFEGQDKLRIRRELALPRNA